MPAAGLLPALAVLAGAIAGTSAESSLLARLAWFLPVACLGGATLWARSSPRYSPRLAVLVLAAGFFAAGAALASDARHHALASPLRDVLDEELGGFSIQSSGSEADHAPILVEAAILEDASARAGFVSLRVLIMAIHVGGRWRPAGGEVALTVNGEAAPSRQHEWRAGRTVEAFVTFRRPARYLNDGVPDFERALALDGTTLFASVKSGLLVDVTRQGSVLAEAAAGVRDYVRRAIARRVAVHEPVAAGIVTAVLIGDRTGLPDEIRERLQAAGTYHVIAISGGNIAILAGLVLAVLACVGVSGRASAAIAIAVLLAYAHVVTAGPSVWRATLMAVLYLGARVADHRTPPWQAMSLAAAVMVAARPLDVRDAGFILTFGATAALLEAVRAVRRLPPMPHGMAWLAATLVASLAVEVALVPVSAQAFSRVTGAGLLLNLLAVPAMAVVQVAGILVVVADSVERVAAVSGWIAYEAATLLVESARLVEVAPGLTRRVPPPGVWLVVAYYAALIVALLGRRRAVRMPAVAVWSVCFVLVCTGQRPSRSDTPREMLRLTMFDVGQGEAMLVEAGGQSMQVDAGGVPFGGGGFDIGARVLAPALWARGVRRLDTLVVTHGDPDHLGGAPAVAADFDVRELWEGIEVPRHAPGLELRAAVAARGGRQAWRRAGETLAWGGATLRVLHPPEPDWERPGVRNDDSVVLEVVYGDAALLLTGDIGADTERAILPHLTPARLRILKVAHHGSRTSSSAALLETWRPHVALISAGRGNTFGHPTPEVLARLEAVGAEILRTDQDGQITLDTDGRTLSVRTFTGRTYGR